MTSPGPWGRGWALVTGASAGLGEDMARLLAARGFPLLVSARSTEKLEALAREVGETHDVEVRVLPKDLSIPGAAGELADRVEALGVPVEVLVNNAGFGQFGPYLEQDAQEELDLIRLNMEALTHLTRRLLPAMVKQGYGRILNVASTAAFFPGPLMTVYYATKGYVLSYSEGLAEELSDTGVTVTCLCPGPTRTEFQRRASMQHSGLMNFGVMESGEVARAGLDGLFAGKRVVIPGFLNRLSVLSPRFLPRAVVPKIVEMIQAGRKNRGDG